MRMLSPDVFAAGSLAMTGTMPVATSDSNSCWGDYAHKCSLRLPYGWLTL